MVRTKDERAHALATWVRRLWSQTPAPSTLDTDVAWTKLPINNIAGTLIFDVVAFVSWRSGARDRLAEAAPEAP
ncbi:MAG: hypothetical protein L0Y72_10225 [Gemmataceae bacterium]|nr:hypothetical protein [Gemmataceae bacterium]